MYIYSSYIYCSCVVSGSIALQGLGIPSSKVSLSEYTTQWGYTRSLTTLTALCGCLYIYISVIRCSLWYPVGPNNPNGPNNHVRSLTCLCIYVCAQVLSVVSSGADSARVLRDEFHNGPLSHTHPHSTHVLCVCLYVSLSVSECVCVWVARWLIS